MAEEQKTQEPGAIKRSVEAQINEWSSELDRLQAEAERKQATEEMRRDLYAKAQEFRNRIEDLRKSGEETRDRVMKDLQERWNKLRQAFG